MHDEDRVTGHVVQCIPSRCHRIEERLKKETMLIQGLEDDLGVL